MEVTWAVAVRISTLGWKKILMIPRPGKAVLSICSISLTVVTEIRSNGVINLPDISSGESPV